MTNRFFLYHPAGDGFQTFPTAELRDVAANEAIEDCLVNGEWSDDVLKIVVGEITGCAVKTNVVKRPEKEDEEGKTWDTDEKYDVEILPINHPAPDGQTR